VVPNYLEQALQNFVTHQETLRSSMSKSFTGMIPGMTMMPGAGAFEELNRKNMEMFSQTMNMFSPLRAFGVKGEEAPAQAQAPQQGKPQTRDDKIKQLKANITKMQEELRGLVQ